MLESVTAVPRQSTAFCRPAVSGLPELKGGATTGTDDVTAKSSKEVKQLKI